MTRGRRAAALTVALVLLCVAGCTNRQVTTGIPTQRGGTLQLLLDQRVPAWDPQRIGSVPVGAFAARTFIRTLTTQAPAGVGFLPGLVGDLATTTGQALEGGRSWTFSLVTDATWQDGRFVTCADVKYGVSRSFARDRVTGGGQYAVELLDIPAVTDAQSRRLSAYEGPYSGKGQQLYDNAVTCSGQSITFHLNAPRYDFGQIVSQPAFAPYRKDQDTSRVDAWSVFSSGPYMLEGLWKPGEGGRFVRNRKWVSRDDPIRLAWPDVIEVEEGLPTTTVVQRILDDQGTDRSAITWADAPAAMRSQLQLPQYASRVTRPDSGVVDVLLPNLASPAMANPAVRRAFTLATDREGYAAAEGSPMTATTSVLARNIPGRDEVGPPDIPVTKVPAAADPDAARALLASSGVSLPEPLRVARPASEAATRSFAALRGAWERAGFAVTLVPVTEAVAPAGADIGASAPAADVAWRSVSSPWPSGSAVLPGLVSGGAAGPGVAQTVERGYALADPVKRNAAWRALDAQLVAEGDLVPLAERQRVLVHGSGIRAYQDNVLLGGLPDLAAIEVAH